MKVNKKDAIIFIIILIFTCLVFTNFLNMHYSTDTYNIINRGYKEYAIKYSLNDGRPVMCLISLFADAVNMPITVYIISLTIIALIISCISVMLIRNIILRYKPAKNILSEIIVILISYVIIFNFTYLENMQYAECAVMAINIMLYIITADILVKKETKNYYIKGFIMSIIAILFYQGNIGFLVTITFVMSILKEKYINKTVIKDTLISGIYIIISVVLDLIQIKITGNIFNLTQIRMGNANNILRNLKYIYYSIKNTLINTYDLFPKYLAAVYATSLITFNNLLIKNKKDILKLINIIGIIVIAIFSSYAMNIFTLSSIGTARMSYSIGATIGLIFAYIYCNVEYRKLGKTCLYCLLISYFCVTVITYINILQEHKIVAIQDQKQCEIIDQWMNEYEESSGIKLENIIIAHDKSSKGFYDNIENKSSLCYRALNPEWSNVGALNFYTNKNLKLVNKQTNYFKDKNWDELNKDQFIFEGNTMYYCIY